MAFKAVAEQTGGAGDFLLVPSGGLEMSVARRRVGNYADDCRHRG
jgi:hypothetical protein